MSAGTRVTNLARLADLEAAADAAWFDWGIHYTDHCYASGCGCGVAQHLAAVARHADEMADRERMGTAAGCGRAAHTEKRA